MTVARFPSSLLSPATLEAARKVAARLRSAGHQALFAGGCVRDAILERPIQDVDIATSATPDEVQALFSRTIAVGAAFGVVIVLEGEHSLEVATFREDLGYSDGRRPDGVRFCSPQEDALRRDFTVNGLFCDPTTGEVEDFVGGLEDLKAGILRAIGLPDARFAEDHLRVLRAARFAGSLSFSLDSGTLEAMERWAPRLSSISAERIRDELVKSLTRPGAAEGLDLMEKTGILRVILPEASATVGVPQPEAYHPEGDVFTHVLAMFRNASFPLAPELALGVLLHDVGKPATFRIADRIRFSRHEHVGAELTAHTTQRLRLSRDQADTVRELVANHMRFPHVLQMRPSTLKRFLRMPRIDLHLELHRLDCVSSHGHLDYHAFCLRQLELMGKERLTPPPLLAGRDLVALGYRPGPAMGELLRELETRQLDEELSTREEALIWLARHHPPGNS